MKILHILKAEPDESVRELMEAFVDDEVEVVSLYEEEVDWESLVDGIFAADKVISWW